MGTTTPTTTLETALAAGDAAAIIDAAQRATKPHPLDDIGDHVAVSTLPKDARVVLTDLAQYADQPKAPAGVVRFTNLDSFARYVAGFHMERSTIWIGDGDQIEAVLDDHARIVGDAADDGSQGPGWGDHRAVYALEPSDEWKHWLAKDRKLMTQVEFAEHLEDGLKEIVEPAAADMLELAETFHAQSSSSFRSHQRLASGVVQMKYDEDVTATAGAQGTMDIPKEFVLGLRPFDNGPAYRLTARLRYRLNSGKLHLGYHLERPRDVITDALDGIRDTLTEQFGDRVYNGRPRPARERHWLDAVSVLTPPAPSTY